MVYVIHANICAENNQTLLAELLATALFMVGLATFLQVTIGVRYVLTKKKDDLNKHAMHNKPNRLNHMLGKLCECRAYESLIPDFVWFL